MKMFSVKRLVPLFLCMILISSIAVGCGANEQKPDNASSGYKIGFSTSTDGNSFRQQMKAELEERIEQLKQEGVIAETIYLDANNDQAKQISDVRDLITMECDAIIVNAINQEALNDVVEEAMDEGIVVVSFDNLVSTDKVSCKILLSDYNNGYMIGSWLGEQLPNGGDVVILDGIAGSSTNEQRHNGMVDGLASTSPSCNILTSVACDWDYATARTAMEDILNAYPNIDGILSQGGAMTLAAIDAFEAAGRDLVPMTGEASNGLLKAWKNRQADGFESVAFAVPNYMATVAMETAIAFLDGENPGKEILLETDPITSENLDDFVREDLSDDYWVLTHLSEEKKLEMYGN